MLVRLHDTTELAFIGKTIGGPGTVELRGHARRVPIADLRRRPALRIVANACVGSKATSASPSESATSPSGDSVGIR